MPPTPPRYSFDSMGVRQAFCASGTECRFSTGEEYDLDAQEEDNRNTAEKARDSLSKGEAALKLGRIERAVRYFREAAEMNLPEANMRLALCYYSGTGVAVDREKTMTLLRRAANQGEPLACIVAEFVQQATP